MMKHSSPFCDVLHWRWCIINTKKFLPFVCNIFYTDIYYTKSRHAPQCTRSIAAEQTELGSYYCFTFFRLGKFSLISMLWFVSCPWWLTSWWNYLQSRDYLYTPSWILILPHPLCVTTPNKRRGTAASTFFCDLCVSTPIQNAAHSLFLTLRVCCGNFTAIEMAPLYTNKTQLLFPPVLFPTSFHLSVIFFWEKIFFFPLLIKHRSKN